MKLKKIYLLLIIIMMMFITILYQSGIVKNNAEFIKAKDQDNITSINVLLTNFIDTTVPDLDEFKTKFALANEFVKKSSGEKMKLSLDRMNTYTTKFNALYYGNDSEFLADEKIGDLLFETKSEISSNQVLVIYHSGFSQSMTGNKSHLVDEYIGANIRGPVEGFPNNFKVIIISNQVPWSILVHELGHTWNLMDQYFDGQIGKYGMMGSGAWHALEGDPTDFTNAMKYKLGWLNYYNITPNIYSNYEFKVTDAIKIGSIFIDYISPGETNSPGIIVTNLLGKSLLLISYFDDNGVIQLYGNTIIIAINNDVLKITLYSINIDTIPYLKQAAYLLAFFLMFPLIMYKAGHRKEVDIFG